MNRGSETKNINTQSAFENATKSFAAQPRPRKEEVLIAYRTFEETVQVCRVF